MAGEYSDSDDEYYVLDDDYKSMMGNGDCSDDENYALVDFGTTDSETNEKSDAYSGEHHYALGGYSDDQHYALGGDSGYQHYALGDYGTSYSKSTTSGGNQVNVYQQTYRAKNEDKQSGSYERFTAKDKTVSGAPFVDRSGNPGYKDEHTTSATYKVGGKSGYTEYYREERVKHVDFDKSSISNNEAALTYPKYNKY